MSTLERALCIASEAHEGQVDKAGEPYILHVVRVMLKVSRPDERVVAALHDVVEDTAWTLERLREQGFSESIVDAVHALTRRSGEPYEDFIVRASRNDLARQVKLADLEDNANLSRISNPTDRDYARLEKYRRALILLRQS